MGLSRLFLFLYRTTVIPFMTILAIVFSPLNRKLRWGLKKRMEPLPASVPESPVWFHCASGEFEYAKPVIRELKKRQPDTRVLVTFYSPSFYESIKQYPGIDYICPLPIDLPGAVRSFIKKFRPRALLIARSDLWPEVLAQTKIRNIPTLLFSCARPPRRGWQRIISPVHRFLYNQVTRIHCVDEDDSEILKHYVSAEKIEVTGDTRFDQVFHRLENPKSLPIVIGKEDLRPIFIFGSIWPEDYQAIGKAAIKLASEKNMRLIFVPHEATKTFIDRMTKDVKNAGLNYQLFSDGGSWSNDVLIVDRTGYLAELYAHASMAFVGGSFRRKVHSVMEALAAGLVTFVGPRHLNNREATSFQKVGLREGVSAVISIEDGLEMFEKVAWLLDADIVGPQIKDMIVAEVARRRGATDKVLEWLKTQATET